jgi:response regulator RpfG family c-di-GMP phosphodiesterase
MNESKGAVLIVDDEESNRIALTRKLQLAGYHCVAVADADAALHKMSADEFDVVLLDIDMPYMSGMEILPKIVISHPDISVLMMTAVDDIQTAIEAMREGAYDYVTKPFYMDDLVLRIEKAIERKRLIVENRDFRSRMEQKVELQVGQIRKYLFEAAEALGLQQMALDKPDALRQAQRFARRMFQHQGGAAQSQDLEDSYLQMARTLASIAEAREPYASGHSDRVGLLANEIAIQLGCSAELIRQIKFAAILQDIGKIVIPDSILCKQGNLTPAEFREINRHPTASVEIIQHIDYFKDIIPLVESHHEWFDGSGGYPKKLKGEQIPLGARILAVADAYDAMTCPRPHRPSLTTEEAAKVLKRGAGKQWDPVIVDAFLKKLGVTV